MAYTQTPGFTKEMGAGITKVINHLQSTDPNKDVTSGETTGTSAKTQGDNTVTRRNLNFKKVEPMELIKDIKSSDKLNSIPVIGYFSHVQTDLKKEASQAGYDFVIPRSRFVRELGDILNKGAC